jgi:hypothetical protein
MPRTDSAQWAGWPEIGVAEIIAFEEQGFIPPLGQGIGEAIAEVEACLM